MIFVFQFNNVCKVNVVPQIERETKRNMKHNTKGNIYLLKKE